MEEKKVKLTALALAIVTQLRITLNGMLERLQSSFVNQRRFPNDAVREPRTPITIVQRDLELMGNTPEEEQQETKEIVLDELKRINRLIADLMLLTKPEQPDFWHLKLTKLSILTAEIEAKAQEIADHHWQSEEVPTGMILTDCQRLIQAITNLAQNATKHTKSVDLIAIDSAIDQNHVDLWVRDKGTNSYELDFRKKEIDYH